MKKSWYKQKTTWAAIGSIATGIGLVVAGETKEGLIMIGFSLQALFQRQATNKIG